MAELKSGEVGRHLTTMPLSENLDLSKTKRRHGKVLSRKRTSTDLLLEKDLGIKGEREEVIWEKKEKLISSCKITSEFMLYLHSRLMMS